MIAIKQKEIDKMMKLKGNVKGIILKGHFDYIRDLKGEKGVKTIEKRMEELGYPINPEKINPLKWYSQALSCLIILSSAEIFKWDKKDVFKMAYEASKHSFIVKLLMQYFIKIEKTFKMTPIYWRKHFDFSQLQTADFSEKEKYGIIRLKDFHKYHPLICEYHRGYFTKIAEIMLGQRKVNVEHTKCLFKRDPYEEFKITFK